MREETRPCEACGGAMVDFNGDRCEKCRGHGFLPAPCQECGELTEGKFCSVACEANAASRGRA